MLVHIFEFSLTTKDMNNGLRYFFACGVVKQHHWHLDLTSGLGQEITFPVFLFEHL
jgi:hypothetical protein